MDAKQKMALGLLEVIEELFVGLAARQAVLSHLEIEGDDYADLVRKAEILVADKVHRVLAPLRELSGATQDIDHLPDDLNSIVRRLLDTVGESGIQ